MPAAMAMTIIVNAVAGFAVASKRSATAHAAHEPFGKQPRAAAHHVRAVCSIVAVFARPICLEMHRMSFSFRCV
jgi:hypothetical protein